MSFLVGNPYDPDREPNASQLATALAEAWAGGDWARLEELLVPEVVYESPTVGRLDGRAAVVAFYRDGRRLRGMTALDHRRTVVDEGVVARVSEATIDHERRVTVMDLLTMRDGRVAHWLSIAEEWPAT